MTSKQVVACGDCGTLTLASMTIVECEGGDIDHRIRGDCEACGTSLNNATPVNSWGWSE